MLRVLSTFSGISAASVAWKPLGFEFVGFAETAPFPCHLLAQRCGASRPRYLPVAGSKQEGAVNRLPPVGIPNFGDVSQVTDDDLIALGHVEVLEGGPPCQAFSFAGLRDGLADARGNLTLKFCQLANRMRKINGTRYVVFENVTGILSDNTNAFGCLLGALAGSDRPLQPAGHKWTGAGYVVGPQASVTWRILDAQHFGIAQRRRRVFVVADFGDRSGCSQAILFEPQGLHWNSETSRQLGQATARSRDGCTHSGGLTALNDNDAVGDFGHGVGNNGSAGQSREVAAYALCDDYVPKAAPEIAYTLLAGSPTGGGHKQCVVHRRGVGSGDWIVRHLMPVECERLQGFPDNWTAIDINGKPAPNGHRYRAIGNSMAVPCMRFVGRQLLAFHRPQVIGKLKSAA